MRFVQYVADTSSLLRILRTPESYSRFLERGIIVTPEVVDEVKDSVSVIMLEALRDKIQVLKPSPEAVRKVLQEARRSGDISKLSRTDISVLALALEKKAVLLTEDFTMQNLARILGIRVETVRGKRIKAPRRKMKRCKVCGCVYPTELSECPDCGSNQFEIVWTKAR